MKNSLTFHNGKIRILQVSDPQDLRYVRPAMVKMLDRAYDTLDADAVIFTGDNILGNHLLDARFGSRKVAEGEGPTLISMRAALSHILEPVNSRGIPFAMIYGNHDDMNLITKEKQIEIYRSYNMCMDLNKDNPGVDCDTYTVELKNGEGETKYCLYMLDSAWQDNDGERKCHTEVTKATVDWLRKELERNKDIPSMAFLHIPLPEQNMLTEECSADEGIRFRDGKYRRLKENVSGYMFEPPCVLEESNGLFEVLKEGGVGAVVTGHDHTNCFIGTYEGVDFIQTGCASFRCYGDKRTRGIRVFDIYEDGRYETKFLTYFDICGDTVGTHICNFLDADEWEKPKFALLGLTAVLAAAGTAKYIVKKIK